MKQANLIKIAAVITAAPRWVIALLAAEGFLLPSAWLGWWVIVSAILSLGMAIVEGFAFSYIFNAWRTQKDKAADNLLWIALVSALVFVGVMTPSISAGVRNEPLGDLLTNDWTLHLWSMAVALSTIVIVAGVGYAEKQTETNTKTKASEKSETKSESLAPLTPVLFSAKPTQNGYAVACPYCERKFNSQNALNPHVAKCKAKQEQEN